MESFDYFLLGLVLDIIAVLHAGCLSHELSSKMSLVAQW